MTATILDGKSLARQIQAELAEQGAALKQARNITPCLAAVLVGDDPASAVYVRNKEQACQRAGFSSQLHRLAATTSQAELLALVDKLNNDAQVHGILVQLPLPKQIDPERVLSAINPMKDVDAFHAENVGLLVQGRPRYLPCTPHGVVQLLRRNNISLAGKHVVIVGRSDIVGKPLANMLVQRDTDATVTICHSRTTNLANLTRQGDIVVVAIGKARFLTADMVRPGAVVVDVGINRTDDGLCGDVDYAAVSQVASAITPVPGGVGPLTVTMLLHNTLTAARLLTGG